MSGWRSALRIARREARRAKGRSALVVALIGLPVFALAFAAVSYDSFRLSAEQEVARDLGAADARVSWPIDGALRQHPSGEGWMSEEDDLRDTAPTEADLAAMLPAGTRFVPVQRGWLDMRTATGIGGVEAEWLDLDDPIHAGRVALIDGRAPAADHEVALSRQAAGRLGATIGDQVHTADDTDSWTVVGLVEHPFRFRQAMLFAPGPVPGAADERPATTDAPLTDEQTRALLRAGEWLVATDTPLTWQDVQELNQHGILVRSREVMLNPPPASEIDPMFASSADDNARAFATGAIIAGLGLLEVVLLAGPAFAVGARRRQRELALVAAAGGTPAHQRRIVLADGVVLGAVGAVAGIALGVTAALASLPLLEEHLLNRRAGGLRIFPLALVGVAGLAVVTGLLAALVPAVTAARQHVVTALAGRRGQVRSRKRWLAVGLAGAAAGIGLAAAGAWRTQTAMVLLGLIVFQLGLVLCTPALVGLVARLGRFLPLTPRIALRDTARNRAAAAPAISAVMAAVAGAIALGVYLTASDERSHQGFQAGLPIGHVAVAYGVWGEDGQEELSAEQRDDVLATLRATLPVDEVREVARPACPPDDESTDCWISVPIAEPHRCPAEALIDERARAALGDAGGGVDTGSLLTPEEQRAARQDPRCQDPGRGWQVYLATALVDDGAALPVLTGGERGDLAAARTTLAAGGVVVTDPRKVHDGRATLEISRRSGDDERTHQVTVEAYALTSGENVPFAVLSPAALEQTGLASAPYGLVAGVPTVPDQAQQDALWQELSGIHPALSAQIETGPFRSDEPILLVLAALAGVVALAAAGIATGLAAADRRADLATLAAVGAAPRVRRALSTSQSGVVAGLGAVLGTVAGLGSATAVLVALNQAEAQVWPVSNPPYQLIIPWPELALLLVVLPAVAMLGAGLLTRSRLPIERRLV